MKGRSFHFFRSLFADNWAPLLLFESRADLGVTGASTDLHTHFAYFGLLVHADTTKVDISFEK
jgi:hypothetical protein